MRYRQNGPKGLYSVLFLCPSFLFLGSCGSANKSPVSLVNSEVSSGLAVAGSKTCADLDSQTPNAPIRNQTIGLDLKKGETVSSVYFVVPKSEAYHCFTFFNKSNDFPSNLQGVWFMNGNELGDELVSPANGEVRRQFLTGKPLISLSVSGRQNFSYLGTSQGLTLRSAAKKLHLYYQISFDAKGVGQIYPALNFLGNPEKNEPWLALFIPRFLVDFTMVANQKIKGADEAQPGSDLSHLQGPFEWIRRSKALVAQDLGEYHFQRMVDGKGKVIETVYQKYLAHKSEVKYVLVPR